MISQNTFLVNRGDVSADVAGFLGGLLESEFGEKMSGITRLSGGVNSEAFRVLSSGKSEYLAKRYISRKGDDRDSLVTEFSALSFLWSNDIRNVPKPLLACERQRIALYKFIDGAKIMPGEITLDDVYEAANFAGRLHSLTVSKSARTQPVAREACFSIQAYIDCIEGRLDRLRRIADKRAEFRPLGAYLDDEILPFFEALKISTMQKADRLGVDVDEMLQDNDRTLSASDFGFHNAIKTEDARLFFIDFEYYGWDDPAKMIADFYLQPSVQVPIEFRMPFFKKVRGNYHEDAGLEKRLSIIYPILGFKWCLIMLNVFLRIDDGEIDERTCPEHLVRSMRKLEEIKVEMIANVFPNTPVLA